METRWRTTIHETPRSTNGCQRLLHPNALDHELTLPVSDEPARWPFRRGVCNALGRKTQFAHAESSIRCDSTSQLSHRRMHSPVAPTRRIVETLSMLRASPLHDPMRCHTGTLLHKQLIHLLDLGSDDRVPSPRMDTVANIRTMHSLR